MLNVYDKFYNPKELLKYDEMYPFLATLQRLKEYPELLTPDDKKLLSTKIDYVKAKAGTAYNYAYYVLEERWPEVEPLILNNAYTALNYARNVIKGRWKELEQSLKERPFFAYWYVLDVLAKDKEWLSEPDHANGRWPECEPYMMKDPERARYYAEYVLKRRWPEAEPYIKKDTGYWAAYKKSFDIEE